MLVKYISEQKVEPYKGLVEIDGTVYANDEEKAISQGFKPLVADRMPDAPEGFYPVSYYEETENEVFLRWRLEAALELEEEI